MTRRELISQYMLMGQMRASQPTPVTVPVHRVVDSRAKFSEQQRNQFSSTIWAEAIRDLTRGGVQLQLTEGQGEIQRYPSGRPRFMGLEGNVLNLVLTDHLPMDWDNGRASAGVATFYEGRHLCVIALAYAHGHQVPFLSVNTVVHELLHVLLLDVFVNRPGVLQTRGRELLVDWHATRLWLFRDGDAIRESACLYLKRMEQFRQEPARKL